MAESVVYEDTPFAEYLAEIGTQEELIKQPEVTRREEADKDSMSLKLLQTSVQAGRNLKEAISTALPEKDEARFEERFRYILCTSHLLNETLSVHFYDNKRPTPIRLGERNPYFAGISQRTLEIILSAVLGIAIVILSTYLRESESNDVVPSFIRLPTIILIAICASLWLYGHMRRRAMKALHNSALQFLETLVYNSQAFDLKVNKSLMMIKEIELVSRGYRLSTPLSPITRMERLSKARRCSILRETLRKLLHEAYVGYCNTIDTIQPEISVENLAIMYNMYNIVLGTEEDDWKTDDVGDCTSLEHLKRCFQKLHAKRRECLCHFLALDVMTPGRDAHRRNYEEHWGIVNALLSGLGTMTEHYLDSVVAATAAEPFAAQMSKQDLLSKNGPQTTDKQLRAYFHRLASMEQHIRALQAKLYICNDDTRKCLANDKDVALNQDDKQNLIRQYYSISDDITYMLQDWELGKQALLSLIDPADKETSANTRPSLEMESQGSDKSDIDIDERASQRTLIDWTQIDEPLDVPAQYFEGDAEPEVKKKLTREERIALQKVKREQELQAKTDQFNAECMMHELKNVLVQRKPQIGDDAPNGSLQELALPTVNVDTTQLSISTHQQVNTTQLSISTHQQVNTPVTSAQSSPKVITPVLAVSSTNNSLRYIGSEESADVEHQGPNQHQPLEPHVEPSLPSLVGTAKAKKATMEMVVSDA